MEEVDPRLQQRPRRGPQRDHAVGRRRGRGRPRPIGGPRGRGRCDPRPRPSNPGAGRLQASEPWPSGGPGGRDPGQGPRGPSPGPRWPRSTPSISCRPRCWPCAAPSPPWTSRPIRCWWTVTAVRTSGAPPWPSSGAMRGLRRSAPPPSRQGGPRRQLARLDALHPGYGLVVTRVIPPRPTLRLWSDSGQARPIGGASVLCGPSWRADSGWGQRPLWPVPSGWALWAATDASAVVSAARVSARSRRVRPSRARPMASSTGWKRGHAQSMRIAIRRSRPPTPAADTRCRKSATTSGYTTRALARSSAMYLGVAARHKSRPDPRVMTPESTWPSGS